VTARLQPSTEHINSGDGVAIRKSEKELEIQCLLDLPFFIANITECR
jgi:hypothetical protein